MAEIMLEVCRRCKVPIRRGRHCLACAQQVAEVRKKRIADHADRGLCTRCAQPTTPPFRLCDKCRAYSLAVVSARFQERRNAQKCPRCGGPRSDAVHKHCGPCRELHRQRYSKEIVHATTARREKRKAEGLCMYCGKVPPADGLVSCRSCLDRRKKNRKD